MPIQLSVDHTSGKPRASRRPTPRKIALVGHPNVGKSALFCRLTSKYVTISNYPGTTVDVFRGFTTVDGREYEVLDTPGIQSLTAESEDERVTADVLKHEKPDLVIQVGDGKNLRRTLLLTAQLSHLKMPLLLALNMKDECDRKGITIDGTELSRLIGVPVLQTTAITGEGVGELLGSVESREFCLLNGHPPAEWVDEILDQVKVEQPDHDVWAGLRTLLVTVAVLLGSGLHLENYLGAYLGWPTLYQTIFDLAGGAAGPAYLPETLAVALGSLMPVLLPFLLALRFDANFPTRFGIWSRRLLTGIPILVVALSVVYQLVGNLGAQVLVGVLEEVVFGAYLLPALGAVVPAGFFYDLLLGQYGAISVGLTYGIAIVLPVVSTFFIAFSFLEDSGYLPRLAVLSDRLFKGMGLNGKAFLPMVLGIGCVTMATMTTRILNSKKERLLASILLALGIPCSAQLGVILGIISGISPLATLVVFGTVGAQVFLAGHVLSRILPGHRSDFILEIPPIRTPLWRNIFQKTTLRVKWFLREALPLFVLGTLILFTLDRLSLLSRIVRAVEPVVTGLLSLPSQTAMVFFLGFLRRDYGAAGLFDMARHGALSPVQIVVSLTVMTLFVPCVANFFVLIKEQGARSALLITGLISVYAILVGAVLNLILSTWSVPL